ncbi:adenosine kinase [Nesidiocoris tenuis]|uniref:Adenosine kinase n=1 Tax=Nesidiocoris tenuis TaxID=355587 RepID=A0ABN7AN55_9HEMI|nr:adenosine kinase [Nesidiocoris tenuis]
METVLREGMLLAMGNPLLDISAVVGSELLEKYGMKPNDAILAEKKHMPLYSELTANYQVDYTAGGSSQNSVRVAQWILGQPNVCAYMGCVGKDEYSEILAKKARDDGVMVLYQYTTERPTGTCAVLVTANRTQRSLCANLAAAECFTIDHLQNPDVQKLLSNADYYYSSSFFLTVSLETILEVAQIALKRDKLFIMNLSAPFLCSIFSSQQMEAFPYVDILFGNDEEAKTFAREQDLGTEDVKEIALKMTTLPKQNPSRPRIVVITQGHLPVILANEGKTTEYPVDLVPADKVVDTNGAGDAFVGGFLGQLIKGESYDKCIKCALWTASQIIQRSGCTFEGKATFS